MAQKQKGTRKPGRNKKSPQNSRYILEHRHEKSHIRRMTAHMKRFPDDKRTAGLLKDAKARLGILHQH